MCVWCTARRRVAATAWATRGAAPVCSSYARAAAALYSALQVTFKADGPLGGIQVIADARGMVKGKVGNPAADPPLRRDGKLDVGTAVGRGEIMLRFCGWSEVVWRQLVHAAGWQAGWARQ